MKKVVSTFVLLALLILTTVALNHFNFPKKTPITTATEQAGFIIK